MNNYLITGGGCPGWYSTFKSLKDSDWFKLPDNIFASDVYLYTPGADLADRNFVVPPGIETKRYQDFILSIVEEHRISLIIPLTDPELVPLASIKNQLEIEGCKVLCSNSEALTLALDKEQLYQSFPSISPKYKRCLSLDSIEDFIKNCSDGQTCFVKLSQAYGSRGTKKIVSDKTWIEGFSTLKPESFGSIFPFSKLIHLLDKDVIFLETLPGEEYSVDCVFDNGTLLFYGVRERETIRNGICSTARFIEDNDKEFYSVLQLLSEKLKLDYNINIQLKRDINGKLKLLEINPRVSGSLGSFLPFGYNLIDMSLSLLNKALGTIPNSFSTRGVAPRAYRVSHFV